MRITHQEEAFVTAVARGIPPSTAAETAGYPRAKAAKLLQEPRVAEALALAREAMAARLGLAVTRDNLTLMLFEAHRRAGTATEEIAAIREIGKLNGLYAPDTVVHQHTNYTRVEQLEGLPEEELLAMAYGPAIEGEFTQGDASA